MSDYTPTTEEVKAQYTVLERISGHTRHSAEFDRWLAEVKAQAWEEAYGVALSDISENAGVTYNRYRQGEDNE